MLKFKKIFGIFAFICQLGAQNQTPSLSPIYPGSELPFTISIVKADFSLPKGLQSYVYGVDDQGRWLLFAGRTNGLHGFNDDPNNFPPNQQNTTVFVIDPIHKTAIERSFKDLYSGLSPLQIDLLSVTNAQVYQEGSTLYMTGGYGIDTATGTFSTKPFLTAVNVPGLIHWVMNPLIGETASQHVRHLMHPIFQVTGGYMNRTSDGPTLLIFGQNFEGFYTDNSDGSYTKQVRRFMILDSGTNLGVVPLSSKPSKKRAEFRRRDLSVVPIIKPHSGHLDQAFAVYGGVFTPEVGVWTIPVLINSKGSPKTESVYDQNAFRQPMNHYHSANLGFYSKSSKNMYTVLCGGISFGFMTSSGFAVDPEIPFINQVTTIRRDRHGNFKQFLMGEYPVILSNESNPGNPLLFGAEAEFFQIPNLPAYSNGVLKYDALGKGPVLLGYIVGGIQSTLPNTSSMSDSAASPYIFKVMLTKK